MNKLDKAIKRFEEINQIIVDYEKKMSTAPLYERDRMNAELGSLRLERLQISQALPGLRRQEKRRARGANAERLVSLDADMKQALDDLLARFFDVNLALDKVRQIAGELALEIQPSRGHPLSPDRVEHALAAWAAQNLDLRIPGKEGKNTPMPLIGAYQIEYD